ncbi:ankyrin repeat domain-containing protein [Ottowia thiooxydans]|uniref:Ankyrin repeat protein n=1 Tax=Ottowia thiooxydans TaxID=219182 RepID=A0ABV2QA34_9BURK
MTHSVQDTGKDFQMLPQIDGQTHVNSALVGSQQSGTAPESKSHIRVGVTEVGPSLATGRDESLQEVVDSFAQLGDLEDSNSPATTSFPQVSDIAGTTSLSYKGPIRLLPYKIAVSLCPHDTAQALCNRAVHGQLDEMRAWLQAGASPNSRNALGEAALTLAVRHGSTPAVTELLRAGACVNQVDSSGCTPLLHAIREGHRDAIELLLEFQAEIDVCDCDGASALALAVQRGDADTVQLLVEAGANIELRDRNGLTPLMWGARNRHPEVVDSLLTAGADINVHDKSGHSLLDHAVKPRNVQVLDSLLRAGVQFKASSYALARLPSLKNAIENECWHVAEALIGSGGKARVSRSDLTAWGLWPVTHVNRAHLEQRLEHALEAGHLHTSRLMIAALNARGDAFVKNGAASLEGVTHVGPLTLLEFAARTAPLPIVLELLEKLKPEPVVDEGGTAHGGQPSARVQQMQTIATHLGLGDELAELQIAQQTPKGSDSLQADYFEHLNRALASAAQASRRDLVHSLMALGADPYAQFFDRTSAVSAAVENASVDIFHILTGS